MSDQFGMSSFLQSSEWQEIQEAMGRPTSRIGSVLVIRHDLPFGFHYLYAPDLEVASPAFFGAVARAPRGSGALFLKADPLVPLPDLPQLCASHSLQPRRSVRLDCRTPEVELLAAMHPKTRYNIRLALRHGVSVRRAGPPITPEDLGAFLKLLDETAARDSFSLHPRRYYEALVRPASQQFFMELYLSEFRGRAVAAALVNFYSPSKIATYLHGGSSRAERRLMAPYLLHWHIIREVRDRGCTSYDFGGIDEERWPGLTRFKRGFGGAVLTRPASADYVFRPRLWALYRAQHRLRHPI